MNSYTLDVNFTFGFLACSFTILKDGTEIAAIPLRPPDRKSCLAALKFTAYLEKIPEPEHAKLEIRMNEIFDEYNRVMRSPIVEIDTATEAILDDILSTMGSDGEERKTEAELEN